MNYQGGAAEAQLGQLVAGSRDRYVLATKYTMSTRAGDPNAWGNHRKSLRRALELSLSRLGTDHVDLFQVHLWDFTTPVEEVMGALDDVVRAGKALHVGVSDAPAWAVAQANTWAAAHGRSRFASLQVEHNLLERSVEHELVPMARAFGLPILAWSPLAFGVLAGKFHDGTGGSTRGGWVERYLGPRADAVVSALRTVGEARSVSAARVALAWLRARGPDVFPIVGARTLAQLDDNLAAASLDLTPSELEALDAASAIPAPFPASMWENEAMVSTVLTGGTREHLPGWRAR